MRDDPSASVTLEHVARAAGVSRATVSRALTGGGPVSAETQRQVRRVADALGYVADPVARALVSGAGTRVVVPVRRTNPGPALEALARDRTVAGVVLVNTTHEVLAALPRGLRGRAVSIGVGDATVPSVDVDGPAVGRHSTEHLIRSGRRRIAMIAGPGWLPCSRRPVVTHRATLEAAGLPVRAVGGGFCAADGEARAEQILRRWPDTDAIVASCDDVALGVLAVLRRHGRQVPGDVAVAGFDDLPVAAISELTSATHPVDDIATAAVRGVLTRIEADGTVFFPSELVLRRSA
jgi:DNA-binding LacI/PurR family transcriptional regulator